MTSEIISAVSNLWEYNIVEI